jgi:hypoxanthine phosphoribosyltransferase
MQALTLDHAGRTRALWVVSWEEIDRLTHALTAQVLAHGRPEVIIGLQRGGLIPAVMLSHLLDLQSLLALPVTRTGSDALYASKHPPLIEQQQLLTSVIGKDVLVVDDVAGTGESMKAVLRLLPSFAPSRIRSLMYFVNLDYWTASNREEPAVSMTYIGNQVHGWVIFPWEKPAEHLVTQHSSDDERKTFECRDRV